MSKRQDILAELLTRLEQITTDNGFQTDAGNTVFIGLVPALGPDDPTTALAVILDADANPGHQGENIVIRLPLKIHALIQVNTENPYERVEAILADIKKAIETDHNLSGILSPRGLERGVTQCAYREQGSEFGGGYVEYRLVFLEQWGNP